MNKQRKVLITTTYNEMGIIIDTKTEEVQLATDAISRQAAIDVIRNIRATTGTHDDEILLIDKAEAQTELMLLPPVEPTLYGYKIELLAYVARVMEKEGITAEQAVDAFDDLSMAVRLIIEETQQKVEEAVMK